MSLFYFFFQTIIFHYVILLFLLQRNCWIVFLRHAHFERNDPGNCVFVSYWPNIADAGIPDFGPGYVHIVEVIMVMMMRRRWRCRWWWRWRWRCKNTKPFVTAGALGRLAPELRKQTGYKDLWGTVLRVKGPIFPESKPWQVVTVTMSHNRLATYENPA